MPKPSQHSAGPGGDQRAAPRDGTETDPEPAGAPSGSGTEADARSGASDVPDADRTDPLIVIHSYGKVASSALLVAVASRFPGAVRFSHGMQPRIQSLIDGYLRLVGTDANRLGPVMADGLAIRGMIPQAIATGRPVAMITGMREPVARSLSVALQMVSSLFAGDIVADPDEAATRLGRHLRELWLDPAGDDPSRRVAEYAVQAPLFWFAEEIEQPFGFDLLAQPFDRDQGYQLLEHGGIRLLLYRQEDAPAGIEAGLARLLPGSQITLARVNDASHKGEAAIYARLKESFRLPREALARIYDNPYVRHFYDQQDIDGFVARWAEERAGATARHAATEAPRGTVVVPVLNNQAYVGTLLRSLMAQWRPDLELLVIDDGSSDRSFDVASEALAARPDIPATLLRNAEPLGMGLLPHLLRHAAGEILIQADSDDVALPGRLDRIVACFDADPSCRLVTSNAVLLSPEGIPIGLHDTDLPDQIFRDPLRAAAMVGSQQWLGATSAFHRSLLEDFAPIDPELCPYGIDLLLAFRATLTGTHAYLSEPLIGWRQHGRNTHRLAGALSAESEALARHGLLELMALAQKIRDVELIRDQSAEPAALAPVAAACGAQFQAHFTWWSRIHNRLTRLTPAAPGRAAPPVIPIPPVVTLRRGEPLLFGRTGRLGSVAEAWAGFHPPETGWNWTARTALLSFRRAPGGGDTVTLRLRNTLPAVLQKVRIAVNLGHPTDAEIGREEVAVSIPAGEGTPPDIVSLLIHVPAACRPWETGQNEDRRMLGIQVLSVELS